MSFVGKGADAGRSSKFAGSSGLREGTYTIVSPGNEGIYIYCRRLVSLGGSELEPDFMLSLNFGKGWIAECDLKQ